MPSVVQFGGDELEAVEALVERRTGDAERRVLGIGLVVAHTEPGDEPSRREARRGAQSCEISTSSGTTPMRATSDADRERFGRRRRSRRASCGRAAPRVDRAAGSGRRRTRRRGPRPQPARAASTIANASAENCGSVMPMRMRIRLAVARQRTRPSLGGLGCPEARPSIWEENVPPTPELTANLGISV